MASKTNPSKESGKDSRFLIEGQVQREQSECEPGVLKLAAYVFDQAGSLLGSAALDDNQSYRVTFKLARPVDVELRVGPDGDAEQIRHSSAYSQKFPAKAWQSEGAQFFLRHDVLLALAVWRPWWPHRICISGHVRKLMHHNGLTEVCPVPYVKVEVFDVDREACWWPWLRDRWEDLLDRPVIRIPDLLKPLPFPPRPFPEPDPAPYMKVPVSVGARISPLDLVSLNPQPLPPRVTSGLSSNLLAQRALNPQPLPPMSVQSSFTRVGEVQQLSNALATRLDRLTLTSRIAPWLIFPHCFYSKAEVCETTTDCNGYFTCCFNWWPFHFRNGRLRFDARPDIIVKVTQIINGVSTVIYMDPYTSTRWDASNAHIDLFLDNEEVRCGNGCQPQPQGSPVFFTRIGNDEVYQINQASGLYSDASYINMAYGGTLSVFGQFGDALTTGAPKRYYRLSYKNGPANPADPNDNTGFVAITQPLYDTRVDKSTLVADGHLLGPQPATPAINNESALYEVRNFSDFYWYNPDWIGIWQSWLAEADTGNYVLRLEVFDQNGMKLSTAAGVDYCNGAGTGNGTPPAPLPPMLDRCDLVITLDNKPAVVDLQIPGVLNACGVIPWNAALILNFNVNASQENGRLYSWELQYAKGVTSNFVALGGAASAAGALSPVSTVVSGAALLAGLTTTCAFALWLSAWAHIRNGYGFAYPPSLTPVTAPSQQIKAIAVEKCPACPPCPPLA